MRWKKIDSIICADHQFLTIHTDANSWRFWIRKMNALLNLISYQQDIDKILLDAKDSFELKYQLLINKCEKVAFKHFQDLEPFV